MASINNKLKHIKIKELKLKQWWNSIPYRRLFNKEDEPDEAESRSHLPSGRVAVDVDGIQIEPRLIPKKTKIKAYLHFFRRY